MQLISGVPAQLCETVLQTSLTAFRAVSRLPMTACREMAGGHLLARTGSFGSHLNFADSGYDG